jgi:hypothetical protein
MTRILHHLKSNVVAYLALFIALGGTSYAAIRIPAHSVGNRQLKNHSVSADKLDRSSIAGYVRDFAVVDSLGKVEWSRPAAHTVGWNSTSGNPGGRVQWNRPIPKSCFALATTGVTPSISYASAELISAGSGPGGAYVSLSDPQASVSVAIICPQP